MSAAIMNHKVMINGEGGAHPAMARNVGLIFHQAKVETELATCAYMYDGGTYFRVNRGCGCSRHGHGADPCTDPEGAFLNTATAGNPTADNCACDAPGRHGRIPGRYGMQCHWKGPAYDATGATSNNQLFDMLSHRVGIHNDQESRQSWDEVVLDARRMQESLTADPYSVLQAIFWTNGRGGRGWAHGIAAKFEREFGARIPVIQLNPGDTRAPFKVDGTSLLEETSETQASVARHHNSE